MSTERQQFPKGGKTNHTKEENITKKHDNILTNFACVPESPEFLKNRNKECFKPTERSQRGKTNHKKVENIIKN